MWPCCLQFSDRADKLLDINLSVDLDVLDIGFVIRKLKEMYERAYRNFGAQPLYTVSLDRHSLALPRTQKDNTMQSRHTFFCMAVWSVTALPFAVTPAIHAQTFTSIPGLAFDTASPVIRAHAEALKPFTVAGERGVVLGQQDGTFEAWVLPVKLLSHLTIEASVEGYSVPIDVNAQSAEIEVRPDRTTITYSHTAFTVRQIMFSPNEASPGTGPVVLFEFDCLHPTDFILSFTPELRWMWPERNEGVPSAEWVSGPANSTGYYVLHADYPDLAGAITIPGAEPGVLAPYQERPQVHPVELKLHIDPARDHGRLYPLLMAVGAKPAAADTRALGETLAQLNANIAASYKTHADRYQKFLATSTSIETPDKALNEAFQWAEVSIEQLRARVQGTDETALVAGYYASGDSARPGFGWFFGRDSLYSLYAINGYGDFALSKSELEFLIHRQRADGKIMHEYSQTAASIDWQAFPYMYAAADSTPLFLLAMEDYARASGDTAFLTANRDAIEKAWAFESDPAHDTDHDGIYDNSQGTGWVESWPGAMPHQEIYLALLDQQASAALAKIEKLLGDPQKSSAAQQRADKIASTIETEYYDPEKSCYAFSHNADGSQDRASTVYPAMAWWDPDNTSGKSVSGQVGLAHPEGCLKQFAAHTLATDWGLRDVSTDEKFYDGMSYHQGSVWPLFTGWAALAEYRGGQPLAGYQMLMENANLTRFEDLGADTELLSGDFYVPFGRSTSHQLWSSAMVITPTLRGLFGISIDAQSKTITVNPHLPASWDHAEILNLPLPNARASLHFTKKGGTLEVHLDSTADGGWRLRTDLSGATPAPLESMRPPKKSKDSRPDGLRIPLPALELDESAGGLDVIESVSDTQPLEPPMPGARTSRFRFLRSVSGEHSLVLTAEGLAGSTGIVTLFRHGHFIPKVQTESAAAPDASISFRGCDAEPYACASLPLILQFPSGEGWKTVTVTLAW
jgi:glycogen debranching enzyme